MARKPQVNWFESKRGYYCNVNGQRHRLGDGPDDAPDGPNYTAAVKRYAMLATGNVPTANATITIREVCEEWKASLKSEASRRKYEEILCKGVKIFGHVSLSAFVPAHLTAWLNGERKVNKESREGWSETTLGMAERMIRTAIRWYCSQYNLPPSANPLAGKRIPSEHTTIPRGQNAFLSEEVLNLILGAATGNFKDYLLALLHSGARPGEIAHAEEHNYCPEMGALVFSSTATKGYLWKNAKKLKVKKDRVIYLPPLIRDMVERRIAKQGRGLIWRGKTGGAFSKNTRGPMLYRLKKNALREYCFKNGLNLYRTIRPINCYAFRHTFASLALKNKTPIWTLAKMMGTSVKMIEEHYGHEDKDAMRLAFDEAHRKMFSEPSPA